jgi:ATP-dependent protease Clp ATPase subunit
LGVTVVGPRCSFCGEPSSDSLRVLAGPGVYICAECVGQSAEILVTPDGPAPAQ